MGRASSAYIARSASTLERFSWAPSRPICRSSSRPHSSWSSILRPPRRSAHRAARNPRPRRRGDRMTRIAAAFALWLCAIFPAFAQNPENLPVVGLLRMNTADNVEPFATGFKEALAALGLVDGRNIRIEVRLAEGDVERLPELAQSLVRAKANVILAFSDPAIRAAQQATSKIPIIGNTGDLVASGFIASLARPGGNVTGVSMLVTELDAKRLEILKEIMPWGRRFALLSSSATEAPAHQQAIANVAHRLGVETLTVDIRIPTDLAPAFASFRADGAEAVNILSSPMLFGSREELGRLSLTYKLP